MPVGAFGPQRMIRNIGTYRDRVQFERLGTSGDDGYGNVSQTWTEFFACWASIRTTPGREAIAAGALEASARATLRVRRSTQTLAITAADRVIARGFTWSIMSAPMQPDVFPSEIEMIIERGVGV